MMNLALVHDPVLKTVRCCSEFTCLTLGKCATTPNCIIEERFDENMLYVKTEKNTADITCPYKLSYGKENEHVCTCPTLYAIYMVK
jgi:hypothetical protein